MQRQLATRREQLSSDEIALYQYQALRLLEVSDALRAEAKLNCCKGVGCGVRYKPAMGSG
ncbi:DUF1481 domain-containing protein [Serratia symbiotica]|uniref:DUF1481 domain-containing protein n=1 Tax=Serratia symbiotica TaxID=138074 RepID=UPI0030D20563